MEETRENYYDLNKDKKEDDKNNYSGIFFILIILKTNIYIYQKLSKNKKVLELRYKDKKNCKRPAQYDFESEELKITSKCTIGKYEDHSYIRTQIIREKYEKMILPKKI